MRRGRGSSDGAEAAARPDAWEVALKLLAMRALSTEELRQRLARRGYSGDEIAAVVDRLRGARYLDDAEFAKAWARSRAERRPLGPARLAQALRAKGIAQAEIAAALAEVLADRNAAEIAELAAARKLKTLRGLAPAVARRRLAAFLERQGFAKDLILAQCRRLFPGLADPQEQV